MVIDAVGIRICAVRGNRESLFACLRNMLDELAKFTPLVEIYLLLKTFKCKLQQLSKQEGQWQVVAVFQPSAGGGANECQSSVLITCWSRTSKDSGNFATSSVNVGSASALDIHLGR